MARKDPKARLAAQDSLSNLAASLNIGKDKAAHDAFFIADLARDQIEAMYRGDWLARKIIDIVPYDSVREWREWAGSRADVTAIETAERKLNLRSAVQRAMIQGRLYGGGAIILGTSEADPAALAGPLYPESIGPGDLRFLHVVSRWQLGATDINRDPLDPFFGEPDRYQVASPLRGELRLHPSRVIRFLGNPLPDPLTFGVQLWSDSLLQTLYDAIHSVALISAGATSLIHEAKVDIVTVPNLSDHLSNAATTAQLSARFSYAAAMKSINNLLLLGDGESWARQKIDFAGLPEMVQTFLQMAAGAADIPVTRLLGQSPAGLSATGDNDTRNYYDMISARQELDLRPRLERLDALLLRSAGVDPKAVSFEFRPLWQLDAAQKAQVALSKAQATQVYAGLGLWPAAVMGQLVQSQLLEDGTYPNAEAIFGSLGGPGPIDAAGLGATGREAQRRVAADFNPDQPRDPNGRWSEAGGGAKSSPSERFPGAGPASTMGGVHLNTTTGARSPASAASKRAPPDLLGGVLGVLNPIGTASAEEIDPDSEERGLVEELLDPTAELRIGRYSNAMNELRRIDPKNPELVTLTPPNYVPSDSDIVRVQSAITAAENRSLPSESPPRGKVASTSPSDPNPISLIQFTIRVIGRNTNERARDYEQQIRVKFGSGNAAPTRVKGVGNPDDIHHEMIIEVKYTEDFASSIYNPNFDRGFPHTAVEEMIDQARRYSTAFTGGVTYYTNSEELARVYTNRFRENDINNFRFNVVPSTRQLNDMITRDSQGQLSLPPHFVVYDYLNPSHFFTQDEIKVIESIRDYFSEEDLEVIRNIESSIFNKNTGLVNNSFIPGLRQDPPRGYLYVRRFSKDKFGKMMDLFLDYVPSDFPVEDRYRCNMPGFRVTVPNGDRYYPFAFHGNLEQWRKRLKESADFHHTLLGQFDHGKFVLSDGESFNFSAIKVERVWTRDFPKSW